MVAILVSETGAQLIHPFNDFRVMAGQGTAALELMEDRPELDLVLCPIGGGGLVSGTATAAKGLKPGIRVVGVEPAGADDAYRSFRSGAIVPMTAPRTIADGLRGTLGDKTFAEIREKVEGAMLKGASLRTLSVFSSVEPNRVEAPRFPGANLSDTKIEGRLDGTDFRTADLSHATMLACTLDRAEWDRAKLRQADLRGSNLAGLNLAVLADYAGVRISDSEQSEILKQLGVDVCVS